jgi:hypothetical protein
MICISVQVKDRILLLLLHTGPLIAPPPPPALSLPHNFSSPACLPFPPTLHPQPLQVLLQGDPWLKAEYSDIAVKLWNEGKIKEIHRESTTVRAPDTPARYGNLKVVAPSRTGDRGKGGSLASRQGLIHNLVHIESWAVSAGQGREDLLAAACCLHPHSLSEPPAFVHM